MGKKLSWLVVPVLAFTVGMGLSFNGAPANAATAPVHQPHLAVAASSSVSPKDDLEPSEEEIAAARSVWQLMGDERYSYIIRSRDEKLAQTVARAYLDALDPDHLIFLASDVDKFMKKPMWSLAAMQGRAMVAPLRIHEIYEQRLTEREAWLDAWAPGSYPAGASWNTDRKKSPWPASVEEQNQDWQRYVDSSYLLSDETNPAEKVRKAQRQRLDRASKVPRSEIMEAFLNSFAQSVDPHAAYMLPDTAENLAIDLSLSLDGIGAVLTEKDGWVVVEEVRAGGPAAKDGTLKVGDKIMAIAQGKGEWVDAKGMRNQDAVNLIRGKSGTSVRLRIAKGGDELHPHELTLVRDRIVMTEAGAKEQVIQAEGHKFGWIKLPVFYADWRQDGKGGASATKDVEAALTRLKKAGVDGVILDLRDNGGGSLSEAISLVGLFMPPADVVQILGADEKIQQMKSDRKTPAWTGPLVLLVNRGSASASEIAAGALQDHGRALVMGDKTFGKGTVQQVVNLDQLWENEKPTLGEMKMTVAQFFRPSGRSTQLNGVVPDISLPATMGPDEGEERYENAAPAAKIPAVPNLHPAQWRGSVPRLQEYARQASASSPDFQSWLRIRSQFEALSKREQFPLNASENAKRKASDKVWKDTTEVELKRLGLNGKNEQEDPVVGVAAEVAAQWLDNP